MVRAARRALHAAGLHRRRNQQADAATLRAQREHGLLLQCFAELFERSRLPCRFLLGQAHCLPREPTRRDGRIRMTQFGRALAELNIEILCANSSQAKGRVERANRTLQDRLVKELRLAGVSDMAAGNMFLPGFVKQFNEKFSVPAEKTENLHRKLNVQAARLADILCHREQRHVGQQLTLAYDRRQIILERSDLADGLAGQYVEIYDFADRPLEVRWKGHSLPYRVFSKDQRVSHTAIVENKRLSHALATVKAQQDIKHMPTVMTNSTKGGYKKRPRQLYGPDYKAEIEAPPAVEMTA